MKISAIGSLEKELSVGLRIDYKSAIGLAYH